MHVLTATCLVSLYLAAPLVAQEDDEPIVIGTERSLHSDILGEDRRVMIYTPSGYDQDDETYPVLYLLDASAHFHHTTGSTSFLAENGRAPEMIVVAVRNTDRTRDLTPTAPEDVDPQLASAGGADAFLDFLTSELTPWLDENYRTRPLRLLIGHSFGGLFALHALESKPGFFQGLIAISPSMQWDDQELVGRIEAWLKTKPDVRASVYMTVGNEGMSLLGGTHKVAGLLSEMAPPSLRWKFVHMPLETHGSVPHRSTYDGLEFVFEDWAIQDPLPLYDAGGLEAVRRRHEQARERLGYPADVGATSLFPLVSGLISSQRLEEARTVAAELGEAAPPGLWNFLARQFEDRDDSDGAIACYRECLRSHPYNTDMRQKLVAAGIEPPSLPEEADVPEGVLQAYAGHYLLVKYSVPIAVSVQDGKLHASTGGSEAGALHAKSATEFVAGDGTLFSFYLDDEGRGQLSVQRGETFHCERVAPEGAKQ